MIRLFRIPCLRGLWCTISTSTWLGRAQYPLPDKNTEPVWFGMVCEVHQDLTVAKGQKIILCYDRQTHQQNTSNRQLALNYRRAARNQQDCPAGTAAHNQEVLRTTGSIADAGIA